MFDYKKEYEKWLNSNYVDNNTKEELKAIKDDDEEIKARFSEMLSFGTAGLRGIMKAGLACINKYTIQYATQGFANLIIESGGHIDGNSEEGNGVTIAFDSRNHSEEYAKYAASVLAANGIKVYLFDELRPTPELSFALRQTGSIAGINITASHNPKEYNGYKAYWADGAQLSPKHAEFVSAKISKIDIFDDVMTVDFDSAVDLGIIEIIGSKIDESYMEKVIEQSVGRKYIDAVQDKMDIVYTPFHGAGYKIVPEIFSRLGYKHIIPVEEQMIPDGNFPTVNSPNPENTEGFSLAIEYAKKYNAELIIGTDPDSDRCGAVVKNNDEYVVLTGNQMACLMMDYIFTVRREEGKMPERPFACKSIVSTVMADKICDMNNVKLFNVLTGFKFIGEKIKKYEKTSEYNFVFGFEESIGFLAGTYARDKDAVFAAMMMAEVGCYYMSKGMNVYQGLQELYKKYGYYIEDTKSKVFTGNNANSLMTKLMDNIRKNPPKEIGLKVENITDYLCGVPGFTKSNVLFYNLSDECAVAVRPSGTEPKIKTYVLAHGETKQIAEENSHLIRTSIDKILSE